MSRRLPELLRMLPDSRSITSLVVVALAALAVTNAGAACPPDSVNLAGRGVVVTTEARFDSTSYLSGTFHGAYDLIAGTVAMSQDISLSATVVEAADAYDVAGVPAGTSVPLMVRFTVDSDI